MRGKNSPERNFVSTRARTHNHQVMNVTCSPLSHPGGAFCPLTQTNLREKAFENFVRKGEINMLVISTLSFFYNVFHHFKDKPIINLSSASAFFSPFPNNDTFRRPWETSLLKTPWEKEKLLVTSNFSFSHSVFYPFE